jgi:glycosyltransferase involved in cell wall biosynthesis
MPAYPVLSIVVPVFNEQESVAALIQAVVKACDDTRLDYELLLVDAGSSDDTWRIIVEQKVRCPRLVGIKFRRNYGQTSAMVAGIEHARGRIIVTMDGDLQNDPGDIPRLLVKIEEGYDIVSGWRKDRKDHWSRVLPSKVANWLISATTGIRLHDYGCSLKAYRAECIKSVKGYGEMHRFFPALASMTGARVAELPVTHHSRRHGKSKYGLNRIFKVFSDIFAINLIIRFSAMPLAGFCLFAIPFLLLAAFFGIASVWAVLAGWTSGKAILFLITAALSFGAAGQLVFLGIIAEMVVGMSDLSHTQLPAVTKSILELVPAAGNSTGANSDAQPEVPDLRLKPRHR